MQAAFYMNDPIGISDIDPPHLEILVAVGTYDDGPASFGMECSTPM